MPRESIVLITGANSDLGLPIVEAFLKMGLRVWGHSFSRPEKLRDISNPAFQLLRADLTDEISTAALFDEIARAELKIELLVNLVGPFDDPPLDQMKPLEWARAIRLNLHTVFNSVYFARPHLLEPGSQIINFTYAGVENIRALPEATAYAAAKAGVAVLTKSLAAELGPRGIRVNAVAPGWIDQPGFSAATRNELRSQIPQRRLGTVDEIVEVVRWLAFEAPDSVTGATINVGGGWEF